MRIIAFIGMPGSGKSVASKVVKNMEIPVLRLGDLTEEELKKRDLEVNEENERKVREELRTTFGMDVYAQRVIEKIKELQEPVVALDGVRSYEEYLKLKTEYKEGFAAISLLASPETRKKRLMDRKVRGLSENEFAERDKSELINLNMGNTIAMGDFFIVNESPLEMFEKEVRELINSLREKAL